MSDIRISLDLKVMLAQQSAREIERTGRSFQEVVDSASVSAYQAGLTAPWGADGDHLKTEQRLKEAVVAGCTHFTYDAPLPLDDATLLEHEKPVAGLRNLRKDVAGEKHGVVAADRLGHGF